MTSLDALDHFGRNERAGQGSGSSYWCPALTCAPRQELQTTPTAALQVTCLALSKSGRYLATGQLNFQGFDAPVLLHDLSQPAAGAVPAQRLVLHKVKVQRVAISPDERFVATLGGPDDGNVVSGIF